MNKKKKKKENEQKKISMIRYAPLLKANFTGYKTWIHRVRKNQPSTHDVLKARMQPHESRKPTCAFAFFSLSCRLVIARCLYNSVFLYGSPIIIITIYFFSFFGFYSIHPRCALRSIKWQRSVRQCFINNNENNNKKACGQT